MEFTKNSNVSNKLFEEEECKLRIQALLEEYKDDLEEVLEKLKMTLYEYLHPTNETVEKIEEFLKEEVGRAR